MDVDGIAAELPVAEAGLLDRGVALLPDGEVFVAAGVVEMTDDPEIAGPLPTVLRDVQEDDLGTG